MNNVKKILSEYGNILKNISHSFVAPSSQLPCPKEKIKESIKIMLMFLRRQGRLTEGTKNYLEISYMELSLFVNDSDAEIVKKSSYSYLNNLDKMESNNLEDVISNIKSTSSKNNEMAKLIIEESQKQGELLLKEIKDFQKKLDDNL